MIKIMVWTNDEDDNDDSDDDEDEWIDFSIE